MAETVNINRALTAEQGDGADRAGLPDWQATKRRETRARSRLTPQAWLTLCVLAALALAALGAFLYQQWLILDQDVPQATLFVRLLLLVGLPLVGLLGLAQRLLVSAKQAGVVRLENDHPVSVDAVLAGQLPAGESLALFYGVQREWAANSGLRSLNQLDLSQQRAPEPKAAEPPALPAPKLDLVDDRTWRAWLVEQPHTMIAGATSSGKTTLARIALGERLTAGYSALVIDPKGKDWDGLPVVGGGRDFPAILATLEGVRDEMAERFVAYNAGERAFTPLAIVIDEVPDIMESCYDDRGKLTDLRWRRFVRSLGSLAREVRISVILLTQSPLVEDIGMNSAMRKNYTRIALGDEALPLIRSEEPDGKRKAQLVELLRGQRYPAALYRAGAVELLDTANVPSLAAQPLTARGWEPRSGLRSVPPSEQDLQTEQTDRPADHEQQEAVVYKEALIVGLKRKGKNRPTIRQELSEMGLAFDNNEYTEILAKHGLG